MFSPSPSSALRERAVRCATVSPPPIRGMASGLAVTRAPPRLTCRSSPRFFMAHDTAPSEHAGLGATGRDRAPGCALLLAGSVAARRLVAPRPAFQPATTATAEA